MKSQKVSLFYLKLLYSQIVIIKKLTFSRFMALIRLSLYNYLR